MRELYPTAILETQPGPARRPLTDRLDPTIGEMTSVIGSMLTELLRRTLRGGVEQIDGELHTIAAEKVNATLAARMPDVERAVTEAAEETARTAAAKTAQQEVRALEQKTQEAGRELAGRIQEAERRAEASTAAVSVDLGGRIETVGRKAEQTAAATAQELTRQIAEAERQARTVALEKAQELAGRIEETEDRVTAATHAEVAQQVEALVARSRRGTARLKSRLKAVEHRVVGLGQRLLEAQQERESDQAAFRSDLHKLLRALEDMETRLRGQNEALQKANQALSERVAELEKPRGLRALAARLFGKGEK
jgi:hypothetical protein